MFYYLVEIIAQGDDRMCNSYKLVLDKKYDEGELEDLTWIIEEYENS